MIKEASKFKTWMLLLWDNISFYFIIKFASIFKWIQSTNY